MRKIDKIKLLLGFKPAVKTHDRKVLERSIIPFFNSKKDIRRVLFVGVSWYTSHYWKFFKSKEYWTIDEAESQEIWGHKRHIVDKVENLDNYFEPGYFDLVIIYCVYGWGMNSREQCEKGFGNCFQSLRKGGYMVLGWNDVPLSFYRTVPLKELDSLKKFKPYDFPPLRTWRYHTRTEARNVIDFYTKE